MPPITTHTKDQKTESLPEGVIKPKLNEGDHITIKTEHGYQTYVVENCQLVYHVKAVKKHETSTDCIETAKDPTPTVPDDDTYKAESSIYSLLPADDEGLGFTL